MAGAAPLGGCNALQAAGKLARPDKGHHVPLISLLFSLLLIFATPWAQADADASVPDAAPLVVGQRTIHIFRAPLGLFSPSERAEGARRRIEAAFERPGEGWTSVKSTAQGMEVSLDGQALFHVLDGDARKSAGETPGDLANQASRILRKAWEEHREQRDPDATLHAWLKAGLASVLLAAVLTGLIKLSSRLRTVLVGRFSRWLSASAISRISHSVARMLPSLLGRLVLLLTWLLGMFLIFACSTYVLGLFVLTRPASESLSQSTLNLGHDVLVAVVGALPGLFIAVVIFLMAWVVTRISTEFFSSIEQRASENIWINPHTAPATRRIVNALLWLFAVAMAYPYLPGAHSEAFKGLSVLIGLMVSIGASGVVGQVVSGIILVYTYALKKGEYVRIQDYEGTVTELSLFVTRLRTGMGEEVAIPNAVVLGNVTRNFSRIRSSMGERGYVLHTTVTIGYDTPWRLVHAILTEAAQSLPDILPDPAPYVIQSELADFNVAYRLITHVDADVPAIRARVASDLLAAIQDACSHHGVQIMSPHYFSTPRSLKAATEKAQRDASGPRPDAM